MAENRQKGYGLTRELANKIDAKYNADDEKQVVSWIMAILNQNGNTPTGKDEVHTWLRDGSVLCDLMLTLQPGSIKKVHRWPTFVPAPNAMRKNKESENISFFLAACETYGVNKTDLFQTVDLYEKQNMAQVLSTIYKLGAVAQKNGHSKGHTLGAKIADQNIRNHDEQKLKEGRNVIGLQMGTNQVASQSGMTAYGLGRQLTPQSK
uniref:Transgelin n=1 Tax=Ciona savignyi TaxID=51511 RepID=H2ZDY1_CIOSA